jgi:hypothetical protein
MRSGSLSSSNSPIGGEQILEALLQPRHRGRQAVADERGVLPGPNETAADLLLR